MPYFNNEEMQRIRFLHFKIKHLEEALTKPEETFTLDDLNLVLEYTMVLNTNYREESHKRILNDLKITANFHDPVDNREIEIFDLLFECARVLWVLAKAYASLSEKYEDEGDLESAVIAMVECSKIYKTSAYFSAAAVNQKDRGITLNPENLELNSEEARVLAQSIAATREENQGNLYFSSKLYSGLSALSKRLFYLKKHEEKKKQQIRAQFHYDMGKACQLKAQASTESSIVGINTDKVNKLQQKAVFYFSKSKEIWENMLKSLTDLSKEEKENLEINLSVVKDSIKEANLEPLDYEEVKKIQDPEPIIVIPENLAPFVPKSTIYLTKFVPKDLNVKVFKSFQNKKLEKKVSYSKQEQLLDKKAGLVRTINEIKALKESKEIDVEKYTELMEKYATKLKMIETTLEKLSKK